MCASVVAGRSWWDRRDHRERVHERAFGAERGKDDDCDFG